MSPTPPGLDEGHLSGRPAPCTRIRSANVLMLLMAVTLVTPAPPQRRRVGQSRRRLPYAFQCVTAAAGFRGATPKLPAGRPIGMHAAISKQGEPSSFPGTPSTSRVSGALMRMTVVSAVPIPAAGGDAEVLHRRIHARVEATDVHRTLSSAGARGMIGWRKRTRSRVRPGRGRRGGGWRRGCGSTTGRRLRHGIRWRREATSRSDRTTTGRARRPRP